MLSSLSWRTRVRTSIGCVELCVRWCSCGPRLTLELSSSSSSSVPRSRSSSGCLNPTLTITTSHSSATIYPTHLCQTLLTWWKRNTERRQTPPKPVHILVHIVVLIRARGGNTRRGVGGCGAETRPVGAAAARCDVWVPEGLQTGRGAYGCTVDVLLDC